MAVQLQLRRGSTADNDILVGANGELTFDTSTNGLRIHDGMHEGGFPVPSIRKYKLPSAEDPTWYFVWSNGWCEQGGIQTGTKAIGAGAEGTLGDITLPILMADANYYKNASCDEAYCMYFKCVTTPTAYRPIFGSYEVARTLKRVTWEVKGMANMEAL